MYAGPNQIRSRLGATLYFLGNRELNYAALRFMRVPFYRPVKKEAEEVVCQVLACDGPGPRRYVWVPDEIKTECVKVVPCE
jgi:hypothetical protein